MVANYRVESLVSNIGLVIGTFAALPYVHLQLESAKRLAPGVPVLVVDDGSKQGKEVPQVRGVLAVVLALTLSLSRRGRCIQALQVLNESIVLSLAAVDVFFCHSLQFNAVAVK